MPASAPAHLTPGTRRPQWGISTVRIALRNIRPPLDSVRTMMLGPERPAVCQIRVADSEPLDPLLVPTATNVFLLKLVGNITAANMLQIRRYRKRNLFKLSI